MAQVPVLPYLVKELGAESNMAYAALQTWFNLAQLLGGLLAGSLVDKYGGRTLLIISFAASALSYAMTALARSVPMLFLSRLPTMFQHAMLAARTLLMTECSFEDRALHLSFVGAAYGIGFAVGPALGGSLSKHSLQLSAWAATIGSLLCAAAVIIWLPVSKVQEQQATRAKTVGWFESFKVLRNPAVRHLLIVKMLTSFPSTILQTVVLLLLAQEFGLDVSGNGLVLSFAGVVIMASQALLVEPLQRRVGEGRAMICGCVLLALANLGVGLSRSLPQFMTAMTLSCAGGVVVATINSVQMTQHVETHAIGSLMALDMSLGSALRLVTPTIGTTLLKLAGRRGIGFVGAACYCLLLIGFQTRVLSQPPTAHKLKDI